MILPIWFYLLCPAALFGLFFIGLGDATAPLLGSFILAYAVFPIVQKMERRSIKREWATPLLFIIIFLAVVTLCLITAPMLIDDLKLFLKEIPTVLRHSLERVQLFLSDWNISYHLDSEALIDMARQYSAKISLVLFKGLSSFLAGTFSGVSGVLLALINLFLFPVFFYYIIHDYEKITGQIFEFLPPKLGCYFEELLRRCNTIFSGFVRGQLIVAGILALLYGGTLFFIGIRFGFLIGLLTGFLSLIPYVGFSTGLISSLLITVANGGGALPVLLILVSFTIIQLLESFVLTPKLVGDSVGLSPLLAMLVLLIGGNLAGLIGMFLAIPIGGIIRILIIDFRQNWHRTDYYREN
ncbi:MAG: AI-2E family transporter [Halobacteriovoraceae bacterium]|nr:AI-2E family transporter [Halobacteriovoraceae bacterium]